nr:hypothetical protein [Tanacetum cinerariifolium]
MVIKLDFANTQELIENLSLSRKVEVDITSSIDSKNELLIAIDLRYIALKYEVQQRTSLTWKILLINLERKI